MKLRITLVALIPTFVAAQSPLYGQCGGTEWAGATTCTSGSTCVYSNPFYSQCVPSNSAPPITVSSSTNPLTTTTTTTTPPPSTTSAPTTTTASPSSNPVTTTKTTTTPSSTPSTTTGLSKPPSGAITIGPGGKYSTVSAGLADTSSSVYFIYAGTYTEQVYITRANITIYGQTSANLTYSGNVVTITGNQSAGTAGSNDASGTVRVHGANVALYNLNIANTYGHPVEQSQAIALSVYGSQFGGYGLKLTGYQDTVLANEGYQFISNSWIEGATDFIFGKQGSLWVTKSIINVVGTGYLTASGRSSDDAFWYVIDRTTVQCESGTTTYLGRPWEDYARVVFQSCSLPSCINPAGWSTWSTSTPNTDHVTFEEYNNTGAGASGTRASFSSKISSPIAMSTVLGNSTTWIDSAWL